MRPLESSDFAEPTDSFLDEGNGYAGNISAIERDAKKNTAGCLGTMAVIVVLICLNFAGNLLHRQVNFAQNGATTEGTVTRLIRTRRSMDAWYSYALNGKEFFGTCNGWGLAVGSPVPVRYLPNSPTESEIVGRENYLVPYFLIAVVVTPMLLTTIAMVNRWQALNKTALLIPDTGDAGNAPEWATRPYGSATRSAATDRETPPSQPLPPLEEIELNRLPTDTKQ